MSSKIRRGGDADAASPFSWQRLETDTQASEKAPLDRAAELEHECERRVREARQTGHREGEEAARRQSAAGVNAAIERLAESAATIAALRPRLRHDAEADVVQLALAIARRILHRELAVDPEALHGLVRVALAKLDAREIARVRVNPSHVPLLRAALEQAGSPAQVVDDPAQPPGAVVFETSRGNLDASVETQLQEIGRGLADRLRAS